eukprot:403361222
MKLRETMPKMPIQLINKIVQKIDNVQTSTIYWEDFLSFLESEGELREIINDMRISQPGTTRLVKEKTIKVTRKTEEKLIGKSDSAVKEGKNSIQFERLIFIDMMDMDYLVTVNDSKDVEIYYYGEMKSMYKFQFISHYGKPNKKHRAQSSMINGSNARCINSNLRLQSQVNHSSQSEYSSNIESSRKNTSRQKDYWKNIPQPMILQDPLLNQIHWNSRLYLKFKNLMITPRPIYNHQNSRQSCPHNFKIRITILKNGLAYHNKLQNHGLNEHPSKINVNEPSLADRFSYDLTGMIKKAITQLNSPENANQSKFKEGQQKPQFHRAGTILKRPRMFSSLKRKQKIKMFGVLGLDPIEDQTTKDLLKNKQLIDSKLFRNSSTNNSNQNSEVQLQFHAFNLKDELFMPKQGKPQKIDSSHSINERMGLIDESSNYLNILSNGASVAGSGYSKQSDKQLFNFQINDITQANRSEDLDEMKIKERIGLLDQKCIKIDQFIKKNQELVNFKVKVADSCPLAIEQKTQKNRQNRSKYPVSDQEREQLRQLAMKKQQFLDKISKEIEEKERLKLLKKKQRIQEGLLNYDDSDYADSDCDSTDSARLRKKDTKKIYPVTISYYQETKLLAICLIDCDVKIYSLKMQGTSLHVNDYYNFQASYLPVSSHLARYKLNNNVVLCLASQEGQVEIYSMDEKEKGKIIWSIKLHGLVSDHGPISKIYYHKDVGLIISTFKGLLQVYDSMEFKLLWETHNYIRKEKTTITTFDFSQYTGFIACGGVEGKLLLFDPSARILSQSAPKAHNSEIISVYFYDKHMQLISISNDRTIQLWDSLKLECIQTIKDTSNQATRFYQSTCFNQNKGILLTACVFIKVWRARIDKNVEFESVQRKAITKNALKEQVKRIQRQIDIIDKGDNIEQDQQKMKDQLNEELVASQTYITSGFDHLQNYTETGNVLVTGSSKLVSVIILESKDQLITLDSDYLMRIWSLQTGKQVTTLLLKTHLKNNSINKKLTSAAVDPKEKYLAVSDEEGLITIHNIHSAGILHSLQKIGTEMTQLQFLTDNTNYWLSAVGWEGKVAFIKLPMFQKNTYTIPIMLKKSVHTGDIFSIDHTEQYAATGGVDNKVCLWNVQSGTVRSMVELPKERPNTFISSVKFAKTSKQTLLFIIQNTGQMHCINPITEVLTENCLKLQTNAHIDFSYDLEYMLSVGESGKGSLLSTKLEDISPKNSFVKSKSKYQTRKSMGNLSTKNGKEDKINTSVQSMNINEYDFDLCFDVVKEWTLHKIMPQNNQAVIMCKFSKYKKYFITATNHGEVKIWDFNGECLSLINQSNYPERQLSKILKQDIQESKNDRNTSKSRPIHTKQRSPIIELSYHSSSDELDL